MTSRPPGTQPERTILAAHRTAAAALVVALALIRAAAHRNSLTAAIAGALAAAVSLAALVLSPHRRAGRALSFPRVGGATALAVAFVSIAGLATSLS